MKKDSTNSACITFDVDGNLPEIQMHKAPQEALSVVRNILSSEKKVVFSYLTSSFESEKLCFLGSDSFFQTIVGAFREHRSLILSPDMIWLKILQSFSRHVNDNSELYRELTTVSSGKKNLVLETKMDISSKDVDWSIIIDEFEKMIAGNVTDGLTSQLVADFSTTGISERMALQITLMDAMKPYFEYILHPKVCGIPKITLLGTTEDWMKVAENTQKLKAYSGLRDWIDDLSPILQEFINASAGKVHRRFWRSIVMKRHPKELRSGGCVRAKNPPVAGWILKFYPFDYESELLENFDPSWPMKSEMVSVPWKYIVEEGLDSKCYPMEFWAGFVGTKYDESNNSFMPRIGWFVRKVDSDEEIAKGMEDVLYGSSLELRLHGPVPTFLSLLKRLEDLTLNFGDQYVELPTWLDSLNIKYLCVVGKYHWGDKGKLRKRFPKGSFISWKAPAT